MCHIFAFSRQNQVHDIHMLWRGMHLALVVPLLGATGQFDGMTFSKESQTTGIVAFQTLSLVYSTSGKLRYFDPKIV